MFDIDNVYIKRFLSNWDTVSFDETVLDEDGEETAIIETMGNDHDEKFVKLKLFLESICKNESERKVIDLLIQGYHRSEIYKELKSTPQYVRLILKRIRDRCKKHGIGTNLTRKKK